MDFEALAKEFLYKINSFQKAKLPPNFDLSMQGEQFVLFFILENQKDIGVTPSDISAGVSLSSARIAATLNSLEAKQMITREIDTSDRRQIIVKLTEKGRESTQAIVSQHISMIAKMFTALGEKDAKEFVRITQLISDIMLTIEP